MKIIFIYQNFLFTQTYNNDIVLLTEELVTLELVK